MQALLPGVEGYMYPNEVELQWSVLIVLYPYITGLVAGAFILASLERVFRAETGMSLGQWLRRQKLLRALRHLAAGEFQTQDHSHRSR